MTKTTTAIVCALLLSACGRTVTQRFVTGTVRPRYGGEVRVILEESAAPPSFREVAMVQANCYGSDADLPHVFAGLRAEAASLGCDTILRVKIQQGLNQLSGTAVCGTTR